MEQDKHERRIANRRKIIRDLRTEADRMSEEAADLRARAERLEASTDALTVP